MRQLKMCKTFILDSKKAEKSKKLKLGLFFYSPCISGAILTVIIPGHFPLKSVLANNQPTFHHNNQTSTSQIDHILYYIPENSTAKIELEKHLCQLENSENISSHDAILGKIEILISFDRNIEPDYSSSYTSFLVPKPKWDDSGIEGYQNQSSQMLENLSNQFNAIEEIPILTELFSKVLVISAKNNFDTRIPRAYILPNQKQFFLSEHRDAFKKHETICRLWRKEGRPQSKDHPVRLLKLQSQRNLQRIARSEKSAK